MTVVSAYYSGRFGFITVQGLRVRVYVLDARRDCGRLRLLVTPVQGTGEHWTNADRVTLEDAMVEIAPCIRN